MTDLVTLRPGLTLDRPAGESWARMEAERGRPLDVNRSYASWDEQMEKYRAYQRYLAGGPWAPLALHPDYSWHCCGRAVDTDDDQWVRDHPDHGWRFVVASEKWHAQHYPELDLHRHEGMPAGSSSQPLPEREELDMSDLYFTWTASRNKEVVYCWATFDDARKIPKADAVALNRCRDGIDPRFKKVTEKVASRVLNVVRANRNRRNGQIADATIQELDGMLANIDPNADDVDEDAPA